MTKKVAVIILNWNGWKDTIECLESLLQCRYSNFRVIVVDNGSKDNSVEMIGSWAEGQIKVKSKFIERPVEKPIKIYLINRKEIDKPAKIPETDGKSIILIRNERNLGFTGGNNIGIAYALKWLNPHAILLLNNDTVVHPDMLDELMKTLNQDRSIVIVQPKILYYHDLRINSTGHLCDYYGYTKGRDEGKTDVGLYRSTLNGFFYATGACMLIKASFLRLFSPNFFDPKFFAYAEDLDLSWKARLMAYKIAYSPKAICIHKEGKSIGGFSPTAAYLIWRNRIRVISINYSLRNLLWILPITLFQTIMVGLVKGLARREFILSLSSALCWNLRNFRETIESRYKTQRLRRMPDSYVRQFMVGYPLKMMDLVSRI